MPCICQIFFCVWRDMTFLSMWDGLNDDSIHFIQAFHSNSTYRRQSSWHLSHSVPLKIAFRGGSPLSMCLYRVALNPFLGMLDRDLTGLRVAEETKSHALSLRRRSTDIEKLRKIIKIQEQPSEATLNSRKFKALDRMWQDIFGVPYVDEIRLLGLTKLLDRPTTRGHRH